MLRYYTTCIIVVYILPTEIKTCYHRNRISHVIATHQYNALSIIIYVC